MKERPILFNSAMVRAILEGRKTQTRRAVKPQPHDIDDRTSEEVNAAWQEGFIPVKCPYGKVGDRLWVRETWRPRSVEQPWDLEVEYAADGAKRIIKDGEFGDQDWIMPKASERGFVPSIHMPRWANRITLEITGIRVERVQEISEADALAEGVAIDKGSAYHVAGHEGKWAHATARGCFETLWNSIYGPENFHKSNPWVWVIEFKRMEETP